jgi:murein DD-endopeptidase
VNPLPRLSAALLLLALLCACASTPQPRPTSEPKATATPRADGFDCSGLVVYSFRKAGRPGLPHSATALQSLSHPIRLGELQPGDLLFFRLSGPKTTHVGIYVGERTFVHAPSSGKRVERVSFDDVYWSKKLEHAGRPER